MDLDNFKKMFENKQRVRFITIKPDSNKINNIENVVKYISSRYDEYFIVKCQSNNGYIHFHGLIAIKEKVYDSDKILKSLAKKIQRDMGFVHIAVASGPYNNLYSYIRDKRNQGILDFKQQDYYSNHV